MGSASSHRDNYPDAWGNIDIIASSGKRAAWAFLAHRDEAVAKPFHIRTPMDAVAQAIDTASAADDDWALALNPSLTP